VDGRRQPGSRADALARHLIAVTVDAHVHFWDPGLRRYAWLDEQPSLLRRFGPEDYDGGAHPVSGMIFVQADCEADQAMGEVRWVEELASVDPRILGIVAYAPVHLGAKARMAVAAVAARSRVVGVRRLLQDEPPSLLDDPALAQGVRLLADHGLPFDLCVRHQQLRAASALVAACPDVTFVLDHLGKPPVATGDIASWRDDLARLSKSGRVFCKLSGLTTEARPDWRPEDVRPYLDVALDLFGPQRCMIGSDWPVSTLATTVEGWFDLVLEPVAGLSRTEREALRHGTACSVYDVVPYSEEA
jgi:predicted TIM-barrel fold metal-dependent hydrolase